jgi:holliday junction DNA helicase RuvA
VIGRLSGVLLEKNPPQITVEAGGVGYEVEVPMSTFYGLPAIGERVTLLTHLLVREDAHLLYGFATESERRAFRQLLKISGVGARTALAVLSGMSVAELVEAVAAQESGRPVNRPAPATGDVVNALLALGYSDKEAAQAVKQLPEGLSLSESIRQALKSLSKA